MIAFFVLYTEPKIREPLYFTRKYVLHFERNVRRFREQGYAFSYPVCPTGIGHMLLGVEVTFDIDLYFITDMCLGNIYLKIKYRGSLIFGSVYIHVLDIEAVNESTLR